MKRVLRIAALGSVLALAVAPAGAQAQIPEGPGGSPPPFEGKAWDPLPLRAPEPPRHPWMAPNGKGTLHVDAYQTDTNQWHGPLGRGTTRRSAFYVSDCASVTFDPQGRIVTVCVGITNVTLRLLDPVTLATLASYDLPARRPSADMFQNFTGGGYFYLDHEGRAVVPTADRRILVMAVAEGPAWRVERELDLTPAVPDGDAIISVLPDWSGRIWFASRNGVVGTAAADGKLAAISTGEPIGNSFAVDFDNSVSIVTDAALYRFEAAADGVPKAVWREAYANTGEQKPGQSQAGSGTTPTLIGRDRVAITDNADPMNVLVFQRGRTAKGERLLCRQPVFAKGAGSTDQSLIATPDLIVAENNHGYTGPAATELGRTTTPGLAAVELHPSGRGCRIAWTSQETAPTVVPKLSLASGLVYTYTKPPSAGNEDNWFLTAIDARTGRTAWRAFAGEGLGFNNNYAPITLSPDGTAYVGVLGGIVALSDAQPPPPAAAPFVPRAGLSLRCRRGRIAARVTGGYERSAQFRAGRTRRTDASPPAKATLPRARAVTAKVVLRDGTRRTVTRRAPRC